jgi:hypothetical protein
MEEKKKFQIKDLIITALMVLCSQVLYRVLSFLFVTPYTMLLAVPIWSIIGAVTYFLVPVKTKNSWMILLFCVLTSIIGFYPPYIISCIVAGIIAMLIARTIGASNYKGLTIGYVIFCVLAGFGGMCVPFLFYADQTIKSYEKMFGSEYMETLTKLVSPMTTVIFLVVIAICALIGAIISKKLLKKHFEKEGMI